MRARLRRRPDLETARAAGTIARGPFIAMKCGRRAFAIERLERVRRIGYYPDAIVPRIDQLPQWPWARG